MKTIEVLKGKVNDAHANYYLSMRSGCSYCASEVLSDIRLPGSDYNIVLHNDVGWYAGTPSDLRSANIRYVLDRLLEQGIISVVDGEYIAGPNY